jgi:hypothetical protein
VLVHRVLMAALGLAPLPEPQRDADALGGVVSNLNTRHRGAQCAGRASVELHTLIFFRGKALIADARVTKASMHPPHMHTPFCAPPFVPCAPWSLPRRLARARRSAGGCCLVLLPQPPRGSPPPPGPTLPSLPHTLQVRSNGLIVFVPKYGIEGPVLLEGGVPATGGKDGAAAGGKEAGSAAGAVEGQLVYDEEKQASPCQLFLPVIARTSCRRRCP